jgi:hypothetical protein
MKALVCCVYAPWPPMGGGDLRAWQTLNLLRGWAEVGLFALAGQSSAPPGFDPAWWRVAGFGAQ